MTQFISEIFHEVISGEQAYQTASNVGYQPDEISLVMSKETRDKYGDADHVTAIEDISDSKHALEGGMIGGAIGTAFGILSAIGITSAVTAELSFIIAGPILGGLASAGAGLVAGSLVGLLTERGISEEEAHKHQQEIENGGIMIGVNTSTISNKKELKKKWQTIKNREINNNEMIS